MDYRLLLGKLHDSLIFESFLFPFQGLCLLLFLLKLAKVSLEDTLEDSELFILQLATFKSLENLAQSIDLILVHRMLLIKNCVD